MVQADRNAANQATAAKEDKSGGNSSIFADQIVGDRVDGLVMPELSEYEPSATDTDHTRKHNGTRAVSW